MPTSINENLKPLREIYGVQVTGTIAVGLDEIAPVPGAAVMAIIMLENGGLRIRSDRTDPTTLVGRVLAPGESQLWCNDYMKRIRLIRDGSSTPTFSIIYFGEGQPEIP